MPEGVLSLVIASGTGSAPVRTHVAGVLTTIGSDPNADVRLESLPARWAVLQRDGAGARLRLLATGAILPLRPGESVEIDGLTVGLEAASADAHAAGPGLPVGELAEALAAVEAPEAALLALIRGVLRATGADSGAVILREGDSYVVPVAETAQGGSFEGAESLLSDTLVRDVLRTGSRLHLGDARNSERYSGVPSVVSLRLRAVLCVPMAAGDTVVGAIFLGKRGGGAAFTARHAAELEVLATMAVPFLVQVRRAAARHLAAQPADLLVGESPAMDGVRRLVERVARSDIGVLVTGETGTGKEIVARALHAGSPRASHPMVALNCAAVPEGLLASELFGAVKGAFTGAIADRAGRIEQADGSTLFLDEVGDMPLPMQAALLRVLEERTVTRLGDSVSRPVDYRLVSATSKDLDAEVAAGRFRPDLLYRLREVTVTLPPLAERGDDVLLLASLFLRQAEGQLGLRGHRIGPAAERALRGHRWPGNVRELRSAVRRAALLSEGPAIEPEHLQLRGPGRDGTTAPGTDAAELDRPLAQARDEFVARFVSAVLARHGGNREAAAAALGISIRSLYRYLSLEP